jgi:hypothetical protein
MEDEILEVGEDGAFEIVSTQPVKQKPVALPNYDIKYNDEEDLVAEKEVDAVDMNSGKCTVWKDYVTIRYAFQRK